MNELLHKFKLGNDAELLLEKRGGGYEKVATVPIGSQALGVTQSDSGVDFDLPAYTPGGAQSPVDRKSTVPEATRREKQWLLRPCALSTWSYKPFPGTTMTDVSDGAMKFRSVVGNYAMAYHALSPRLCPDEMILYVNSPDWSKVTSVSVTISDAAGTSGWTWVWAYTSDIMFYGSGIRALRMVKANYKTLVGTPNFASTQVEKISLSHAPINAGDMSELWFYGLEFAPARANRRATLSIGADDCLVRWYTEGIPVLQSYGIYKSYQSVIYDQIGEAGFQTKAQVNAFLQSGGECIVHGPKGMYSAETGDLSMYNTYSEVVDDLAYNKKGLIAEGWAKNGSEDIYVFPRSVYQKAAGDDTIYRAVRSLFKVARITNGGTFCRDRLDSHSGIRIIGHTWSAADEAANIAAVIASIADGVANGFDMCLMFHDVTASPASATEISAANLAIICAEVAKWVALGWLDIMTPTEQWLPFVQDSQF